jgi:starvation-inducible DNA-binding protein
MTARPDSKRGEPMNPTKIDIPSGEREPMITLLNERLADLLDLKLQIKQAHWNVAGPAFIALHLLFDEMAGEIDDHADTVAERAKALGGTAEGTVAAIARRTTLAAYPVSIVGWRDHVAALSTAFAQTGKAMRAAIDTSSNSGDADTADVFTEVSRDLDKKLWFLEAHLHGEK